MIRDPRRRRQAAHAARAGALISAVMLSVSAWAAVTPDLPSADAATNAGAAQIKDPDPNSSAALTAGGSDTDFAVALPSPAECTGDSASDGYRVQSYMVPASVDPATLTFGATGPLPVGTGADFRQPLWDTAGNPYVNALTDLKVEPNPGGNISGIPAFDFSVYGTDGPQILPVGTYNLGIACTLGPPSSTQIDRFWNVQMVIAHDPADQPSGITWTVEEAQAVATTLTLEIAPEGGAAAGEPVTLTATVEPAAAAGTVTFLDGDDELGDATTSGGEATLTVEDLAVGEHSLSAAFAPSDLAAYLPATASALDYSVAQATGSTTTTTEPGSTTTTALAPVDTTTTTIPAVLDGGFSGGTPSGTPLSRLPTTGGSTLSLVVWSALLLVTGRMAVLLGRAPAVIPATG